MVKYMVLRNLLILDSSLNIRANLRICPHLLLPQGLLNKHLLPKEHLKLQKAHQDLEVRYLKVLFKPLQDQERGLVSLRKSKEGYLESPLLLIMSSQMG